MKVILKLSITFLLLLSVIIFLNAPKIEPFRNSIEENFDLKKEKPVFNYYGRLIGMNIPMEGFKSIGTYPRVLENRKIILNDRKEIRINPIEDVIVCEEVERIVTIGPFDYGHYTDGNPYLIIYDFQGNVVHSIGHVVYYDYKFSISKKGEIYISGISINRGQSKNKRVIVKLDKNGKKEWEVDLPDNLEVKDIKISKDGNKIIVLQTGFTIDDDLKSNIIILIEEGKILNSTSDNMGYSSIDFLGEEKIVLSSAGNFCVKNIANLKDIIPLSGCPSKSYLSHILVYGLEDGNSIITLDRLGAIQILEIQEKEVILKREFQLKYRRKLQSLRIIDNNLEVYFKDKLNLRRQTIFLFL